jgi:hypothetical protein
MPWIEGDFTLDQLELLLSQADQLRVLHPEDFIHTSK